MFIIVSMFQSLSSKIALFALTLGFLLYANTLSHGYVLDDFSVIKDNFVVKQGSKGLATIWKTHYRHGYGYTQANLYRPLPLTFFALQWELAPDDPHFAHWWNVILYGVMVVLLFYWLLLLFGKERLGWIAAGLLLFTAHPLHTEVVANIKSIDEILALGFTAGSLIFLHRYLQKSNKVQLIASLLLFTLAFFSKESTITFLAIIPLILVLFYGKNVGQALKKTVWYLIPTAIYLLTRIQVLGSLGGDKTIAKIDNMLLAAPDAASRLATAIKICGLYLWKLIFPHPLMNDYSLHQIAFSTFADPLVWVALLAYLLLFFIFFRFFKTYPLLSFSIGFYLITFSLYSNLFFTIGTSFGERLLFVPSLGFCLAISWLLFKLFKKDQQWCSLRQMPLLIIVLLIAGAYSFKTISRNQAWKDNFTLYAPIPMPGDRGGWLITVSKITGQQSPTTKNPWNIILPIPPVFPTWAVCTSIPKNIRKRRLPLKKRSVPIPITWMRWPIMPPL